MSTPATAAGRPGGRLVPVLAALSVLLLAAAVALTLTVRNHRSDQTALEDAREGAVTAARQLLLNFDGLSATSFDRNFALVTAGSTGDFKDSFTKARADLRSVVVGNRTDSMGTVLAAAVVRADTDTATVLVAVDRRIKDKTKPQGVVAHDRWQLAMEKHGGMWLVADLQPVA